MYKRQNPDGAGLAVDLDSYYERNVIGGAGSFSLIAHSDVFAATILRKLVREIAGRGSETAGPRQMAQGHPEGYLNRGVTRRSVRPFGR